MTFSGPLADRIAIRELIETYGDAVFRKDAEAWASTWTKECVWTLMGQDVRGRDAVVGAWKQAMSGFAFAAFYTVPGALNVQGESATGRCYTIEILKLPDGSVREISGLYEDAFEKVDGEWKFAARSYSILIDRAPT
jgi:uncharacterized protein (TIGR02246 family)